jgi:hypothetical protein
VKRRCLGDEFVVRYILSITCPSAIHNTISSDPTHELKVLASQKRQCCQHALSATKCCLLRYLPKATHFPYSNNRQENRSRRINNVIHSKNLLVFLLVLDIRFRTYLRLPDVQPLSLAMSSMCSMPRYYKSNSAVRKPYHGPSYPSHLGENFLTAYRSRVLVAQPVLLEWVCNRYGPSISATSY